MSALSDWWRKWYGEGTPDDRRNFMWRLSEYLRVQVLWAWTILDVRVGHTGTDGIWRILDVRAPYRTRENFWNAVFSVQLYLVAWRRGIWPKLHIVFRPCRGWFLLIGTSGLLFDRGEYQTKVAIMKPEGNEPLGWEEGSL